MAQYSVSPEEIQQTASTLATGHQNLTSETTKLGASVQTLIDGGWSGAGSEQFTETWQQYHQGTQQMLDALNEIQGLLTKTGTAYADADAGVAKAWTR